MAADGLEGLEMAVPKDENAEAVSGSHLISIEPLGGGIVRGIFCDACGRNLGSDLWLVFLVDGDGVVGECGRRR